MRALCDLPGCVCCLALDGGGGTGVRGLEGEEGVGGRKAPEWLEGWAGEQVGGRGVGGVPSVCAAWLCTRGGLRQGGWT